MECNLKCSNCNESLQEPKLLPCLHTFCKSPCLERLVVQGPEGQSLTCPTCEHHVILPDNGVAGLQTDLQAERLLQASKFPLEKLTCDNDCENIAARYCHECGKFLCEGCTAIHENWGDFKSHKIFTTNEIKANPSKIAHDRTPKCKKHKLDARFCCKSCSVLICETCKTELHVGHEVEVIKDKFEASKNELEMGLLQLRKKLPKAEGTLQSLNASITEVNNQSSMTTDNIDKEIGRLQQLLIQRKESLTSEVKELAGKEMNELTTQKLGIEITLEKMSRCLEYTEDSFKNGTDGEVVVLKPLLTKRIKEISSEFNPEIAQPQKEQFFMELGTDQQASRACQEFGEIIRDPISAENSFVTGDGTKFAMKGELAQVEVHPMTRKKVKFTHKFNLEGELVSPQNTIKCHLDQRDGQHIITYKLTSRGTYNLNIRVNGQDIKGSSFSIAGAPSPENLLQPFRIVTDLNEPYRATTNSLGQIILYDSSLKKLLVMTQEGERQFEFGDQGLELKKQQHGVAVDEEDNIYITDRVNHCVLKFKANREFVAVVGSRGSEDLQFNTPIGICCNKKNHLVYVCDRDNHRIQVLNTDLTFVKCFGGMGNGDGQFVSPRSAALDKFSNLYVVDDQNNRVQVFTANGKFLRMFSKKHDEKTLVQPYAIAVDSSNVVYVSETKPNCISMFTTNGDFIRSFGGKEGQFNKIRGLHIDSDDSLLVSDAGNDRLQIFRLN